MSNRRQCSVYVVDDEVLIARTLASILADHGFEVTWFTDPLEVLALIGQGSPAVLVSDVVMPGITGIELARKVREKCPACRIFLMSALNSVEDLMDQAGAQALDVFLLHKPFHPDVLLHAMQVPNDGAQ